MRLTRTRLAAAVLLPAAGMLLGAGCSSHSSRAAPAPARSNAPGTGSAASPARAAPGRTARVFYTSVTTSSDGTQTVSGQGLEDFAGGGRLLLTLNSQGKTVESRRFGSLVYVRSSPPAAGTTRQWSRRSVPAGVLPGSGATALDPGDAFSVLTGVSDQVTTVGPGTVRGTSTTHYRLTVNVAKAAAQQGAAGACAAHDLGPSSVPLEVEVDAQGRVRRIVDRVSVGQQGSSPTGASIVVTQDYTDFGVPVSIPTPPAEQVDPGPVTPLGPSSSCPTG